MPRIVEADERLATILAPVLQRGSFDTAHIGAKTSQENDTGSSTRTAVVSKKTALVQREAFGLGGK